MLSYRHADLLDSFSKSFRVGDRVRPSDEYKEYLVGSGWDQEDVDNLVGSVTDPISLLGERFIQIRWDGDRVVDNIEKSRVVKL